MNIDNLKQVLSEVILDSYIKENENMNQHTTFKIGGPADLMVSPTTVEELGKIIKILYKEKVPYYIIGNGSNLLVSDKGYRGVIIEIFKNLSNVEVIGNRVKAQAGALLSKVAREAQMASLGNFEFAHGIPGTLGGAVTMNAGAYGGEMVQVIAEATVLTKKGELLKLTKEELELGYRTSCIEKNGYIVVEAVIELEPANPEEISAKMKDFMQRRRDKQPLEFPSAGSTFKRPEGYFAGKLIMDSELRGHQIGGARVSDKHCGFIINADKATCKDVKELIQYVQQTVKEQFDVELKTEVKMIGEE